MTDWREPILQEFTPQVARLTLVADPDGLLLEERILEGIRARGFELMPFADHIAFRYAYESKFRSRWDRGEPMDLVAVLHTQASALGALPYDLLQAGRRLAFTLGDIFPNLSYPVVAALDRGDWDILYEAQRRHAPGPLGDNATKAFVLRHVFEIAPELIKQPADLLRTLLRRHYRGQRIPALLDQRLIQLLRDHPTFDDWPLEILLPDREAFFSFLQERWPLFLDRLAPTGQTKAREDRPGYGLVFQGPVELPFDHHDIRIYLDTLFLEGQLHAVPHEQAPTLAATWVSMGVRIDPSADRSRRLARLTDSLQTSLPAEDARHGDWFHFARGWAELILLAHAPGEPIAAATSASLKNLQAQVDAGFTAWLLKRYAGLINLPPVPPVMLHHLPRFLARRVGEDRGLKLALLVVDGLALDQWLVVREVLLARQPGLHFQEHAVFAWIPAVTSISRQATFAGKPPLFFPNSLQTTDREPALWAQFWADQGLAPNEVIYLRGLGDGSLDRLAEALSHPKVRIAGLVIDKIDKIMHGMELGTAGMHNQVRQWAQHPYLNALLELLLNRGFQVVLTSDHGNLEAEGCGRPAEGAVADLRGERVRIYPDPVLRRQVNARFPAALAWEPVGLPDTYLPLLAPSRQAFVRAGERIVTHGGISVEELIVPWVQIERKSE